ncbi:MAG: dTDP-glucose 4,6-dehydratase [Acidobacteriaceae bacterium]|nr:dTDP-glucose 4,6-dehydratase [Acidobacteriaceae bacterium]
MKLLVTGGAGFIGSCFVRMALKERWTEHIVNVDKLTYAGNLENVAPVADHPGYRFIQADICDADAIGAIVSSEMPDAIVHFAAESHVDRSIHSPAPVIQTNINGTFTLLEAARRHKVARFVHISTDEVYGSIEPPHDADENYPLRASSPYSASKAGSDLLALSYFTTYRLNLSVTRASNNYGPYQFPEKLIPLMISNALENKPLPVYGDGQQIRDWLHVEDHCRAVQAVLEKGRPGEIYNIGGNCSLPNIEVVHRILRATGKPVSLITRVEDRPGHDRRYALTNKKLSRETGWEPRMDFDTGLAATVDWYQKNPEWVRRVKTGEYRHFYELNYANRSI